MELPGIKPATSWFVSNMLTFRPMKRSLKLKLTQKSTNLNIYNTLALLALAWGSKIQVQLNMIYMNLKRKEWCSTHVLAIDCLKSLLSTEGSSLSSESFLLLMSFSIFSEVAGFMNWSSSSVLKFCMVIFYMRVIISSIFFLLTN